MIWLALSLAAIPTVPTNPLARYGAGVGSAGSVTLTPSTPVVGPSYGRLAADVAYLDTEVELVDASGFSTGDLVLFWQVTGPPEPNAGDVYPDLEGAGRYHLARVASVTGDRLVLDGPSAGPFPSDHTQVVQVLEFEDLTIEADVTVSVPPWDGETGGILFVTVSGTLDSEGLLDGTDAGFRGGDHEAGAISFGCDGLENNEAGQAGEGLHGTSSRGRGNRGTSGGGGNCHNAGGAGGGHRGAGGGGGESYDFARDVGGLGGAAVPPPAFDLPDRLFMGSGGGGGHTSAAANDGHPGGGVVVVIADTVISFGAVDVSGGGGGNGGEDGGGGGGAGGTVVLVSMEAADCIAVRADGGVGTDSDDDLFGTCTGPGGGGGGGLAYMSPTPLGSCAPQALAGANGVCDGRTSAGADPGGAGLVLLRPETDLDADGDGSPVWEDCQDGDPRVTPGADEICDNGVDDDCDLGTPDDCDDSGDTGLYATDADTDNDTDADVDTDTDLPVDAGDGFGFSEEIVAKGGCGCQGAPSEGFAGWALLLAMVARRR